MQLDNFGSRSPGEVVLTPGDKHVFAESGIGLCGGTDSDGVTSLRGKVWELFVAAVTGESLYREWLPPESVAEMADKLDVCDPDTARERLDLDADFIRGPHTQPGRDPRTAETLPRLR
jgi:hypothetical protein